jgi:phosphatidylglycerophosphate synthase
MYSFCFENWIIYLNLRICKWELGEFKLGNYIKELRKTMTEKKRREAKNDFFAFYVGRQLSYFMTIPFLKWNCKPNVVSIIAAFEVVLAGLVLGGASSIAIALLGWLLFFIWNLLDGVDGNIARLKKNGSKIGSVYDAMSGYEAMFLLYFSAGIYGFNITGQVNQIILGALSGMFVLFPRLIMHKTNTELGAQQKNELADKKSFGLIKIIALNLTSITGFVEVLLLLAIIFNQMSIFNLLYFMINLVVMLASLFKILRV